MLLPILFLVLKCVIRWVGEISPGGNISHNLSNICLFSDDLDELCEVSKMMRGPTINSRKSALKVNGSNVKVQQVWPHIIQSLELLVCSQADTM